MNAEKKRVGRPSEIPQDARLRLWSAKADLAELEVKQRACELIHKSVAEQIIYKILEPIKQRLNELPVTLASRCNPADPEHARGELSRWVSDTMKLANQTVIDAAEVRNLVSEKPEENDNDDTTEIPAD